MKCIFFELRLGAVECRPDERVDSFRWHSKAERASASTRFCLPSEPEAWAKSFAQRTDIFAFGALLYEMLSGKKAFPGDDVSEILAAVIKTEPDWDLLPNATPGPLRGLLKWCPTKDVKQRARDIGDVRIALGRATGPTLGETADPVRSAAWRPSIATALAAAIVLSAITGLVVRGVSPSLERPRRVAQLN